MSNRENAIRSALNRTLTFPNCITGSDGTKYIKIAKLTTNGYYKFFIKEEYNSTIAVTTIEVLNKKVFIVNPEYVTSEKNKIIGIRSTDNTLYIKGFYGTLSVTVDYFEEFETELSITGSSTITEFEKDTSKNPPVDIYDYTYTTDSIYYRKPIITSEMTVGENINVQTINTSGQINVDRIKFGNWIFSLGEPASGSPVTTECYISHTTLES